MNLKTHGIKKCNVYPLWTRYTYNGTNSQIKFVLTKSILEQRHTFSYPTSTMQHPDYCI